MDYIAAIHRLLVLSLQKARCLGAGITECFLSAAWTCCLSESATTSNASHNSLSAIGRHSQVHLGRMLLAAAGTCKGMRPCYMRHR